MKLIVAIVLAFSSFAFADSMAGVSKGETFGFYTTSGKITGTWGNKIYSIEIYQDEWRGTVGDKEFKLVFWNPDIEGTLPCGDVKFSQWSTELEGTVCSDSFTIVTGSQRRSDTLGFDTVVAALVADFPAPVQGLIREEFEWYRPGKQSSKQK
jgi:hypothetical protein